MNLFCLAYWALDIIKQRWHLLRLLKGLGDSAAYEGLASQARPWLLALETLQRKARHPGACLLC